MLGQVIGQLGIGELGIGGLGLGGTAWWLGLGGLTAWVDIVATACTGDCARARSISTRCSSSAIAVVGCVWSRRLNARS